MKVFMPANVMQLQEKSNWFEMDACKELTKRGVEFGFEIKDFIGDRGVKIDLPFAIHLPYDFVNLMCAPESRNWAKLLLNRITYLHPSPYYVVLHGMRLGGNKEEPPSREKRYISRFGAGEYGDALNRTVEIARDLKKFFGPSVREAIDNTPFTNIYQPPANFFQGDDGQQVMETCLCIRVGSLSDSLLFLRRGADCDIVVDFEHLSIALGFAQRSGFYDKLEGKIPPNLSIEEGKLIKECGLFLRKEFTPIVTAPFGSLEEEIECLGPDIYIYHIAGSCGCGEWHEICEGKVAHHSSILPGDKNVIRMLNFLRRIQRSNDFIFVLEVCGSGDIPGNKHPEMWTTRSAKAQRESLDVFCQMLLDIWYK